MDILAQLYLLKTKQKKKNKTKKKKKHPDLDRHFILAHIDITGNFIY